jgi:DNA-binding transcriptional LysR family regulator
VCAISHTPEFEWDGLRSFLAVVRTGRLTAAALQLQIDHSTLSRRIAALESALQAKLFDRLPTGYVLTPAGERLVLEAEAIERVAIRISSELSDAGTRMTGSIRLATPEGFGTYFFARQLHVFVQRYPEVTLELIANPSVVSVTKRQADIAVTMSRPKTGPLRAQRLADYEYGLYGSKTFLSGRPKFKRVEDVQSCRLIGYIPDLLPTPAHDYLKEIFDNRQADLRVSNILTQLSATLDGYGLCVLPCFMASAHADLVRILAEDICFTRSYWLVTHSEVRAPARVTAMKNFLLESVKDNRSLFQPTAGADTCD